MMNSNEGYGMNHPPQQNQRHHHQPQHNHHQNHNTHNQYHAQNQSHRYSKQGPHHSDSNTARDSDRGYQKQNNYGSRINNRGGPNSQPESGATDKREQPASNGQDSPTNAESGGTGKSVPFDAKRLRKAFLRRTVDYNSGLIRFLEVTYLIRYNYSLQYRCQCTHYTYFASRGNRGSQTGTFIYLYIYRVICP
jgi:hypothetical protein